MVAPEKARVAVYALRQVAAGLDDQQRYSANDLATRICVDAGRDISAPLVSGLVRRLYPAAVDRPQLTGRELKEILAGDEAEKMLERLAATVKGREERRGQGRDERRGRGGR